jgi:hypothetical protein
MDKIYRVKFQTNLIISACILFLLSSCTVKWVGDYDAEAASNIQKVAKTTDAFLLNMMLTSSSDDGSRQFENYAGGYAAIESELVSLRLQNQVRPINDHSIRISKIALEMWLDYMNEHKNDDSVSDGILKLNRMYMQDVFRAMLIAEEGKNFVKPE